MLAIRTVPSSIAFLSSVRGRYIAVNTDRNPFRWSEYWVIPMVIAFASYVAQMIAGLGCSR